MDSSGNSIKATKWYTSHGWTAWYVGTISKLFPKGFRRKAGNKRMKNEIWKEVKRLEKKSKQKTAKKKKPLKYICAVS